MGRNVRLKVAATVPFLLRLLDSVHFPKRSLSRSTGINMGISYPNINVAAAELGFMVTAQKKG